MVYCVITVSVVVMVVSLKAVNTETGLNDALISIDLFVMCLGKYIASSAKVRGRQHLVTSNPQSTQQMIPTYIVEACVVTH